MHACTKDCAACCTRMQSSHGSAFLCAQKPGSVAFPQDRQLAIASPSGSLGVISTTTLANILGLQGDEPMQRAPGEVKCLFAAWDLNAQPLS